MHMTIQKAIEILNQHAIVLKTLDDHDYFDSICLGIEALKVVSSIRNQTPVLIWQPLKGETES